MPKEGSCDKSHRKAEQFFRFFMGCQSHLFAFLVMVVHNESNAEDLLQDTAVALWDQFDEFERDKSFLAWGLGIARNKALAFQRKTYRTRARLSQKTYEQILHHATLVSDQMGERKRALEECVEQLGQSDRRIVAMRYEQNTQIKKIAERLGRSSNGIYKTMARIHHLLEDCVRMTLARWEGICHE